MLNSLDKFFYLTAELMFATKDPIQRRFAPGYTGGIMRIST